MRFLNFILRHRKLMRYGLPFLILFLFLIANIAVYLTTTAGPFVFVALLVSIVNVVNQFAPEILSFALQRLGPSKYEDFVVNSASTFSDFTEEYFSFRVQSDEENARDLDLFSYLDKMIRQVEGHPFGSSSQKDKRRRPAVILLFLIKNSDILEISEHENILSYIKNAFAGLTKKAKEEFTNAYSQLVLQDRHFRSVDLYFDGLSEKELETVRLQFFDRFMKDDFIKEIAGLLNMKDDQIRSFKASVKAVAESNEFNLEYLREFVRKRKSYRKLFLVVSRTRLPKPIQLWIRQQPHFILSPSSIANLPLLGLSSRFDIFFFSPTTLIPSSQSLHDEFMKIDDRVKDHPLRIYEIDPSESNSVGLDRISHFSQAMTYFETTAIDGAAVEELSYSQLLSLLEHRKVSLLEVISDLSPAEYASSIRSEEKTYVNELLGPYIENERRGVFALTNVLIKDVRSRLQEEDEINIDYSGSAEELLFGGNETLHKKRMRILDLFREISSNLTLLDQFLV